METVHCGDCGERLHWVAVAFGRFNDPVCGACIGRRQAAKRGGPANARFWTWHRGGWVKLTLRPGQSLMAVEGGATDEGWSHEVTTWEHVGDGVLMEWESRGRDCDGFVESGGRSFAGLGQLAARPMDGPDAPSENAGIVVPEWARVGSGWQRDHAAEAAGY